MHRKHKCCCCSKIATWYNEYGNKKRGLYYCDDCIKRGSISNVDNLEDFGEPNSSNNIMWWHKDSLAKDLLKDGTLERDENSFYYEVLDESNRRNPSSDFIFNKDGFSISENEQEYYITWQNIYSTIEEYSLILNNCDYFLIKDAICDIFLKYRDKFDRTKILYNKFMCKVGFYMSHPSVDYSNPPIYNNDIRRFYLNIKQKISEKKVSK